MSTAFVVVQVAQDHGPGLLAELLDSRGRSWTAIRRDQGGALPPINQVRALVVLGGAAPDTELTALAHACVAADVPVLAVGLGARALVSQVTAAAPELAVVMPREQIDNDELFAGLDHGTPLAGGATLGLDGGAAADALPLADADGALVAVRVGARGYALGLQPQLDLMALAAPADDEEAKALARRDRFVRPHALALLGRWIDGVVGRTDDETPWGRSGPPPVPAEGLYLNPA